jgi:hypothetical protein
MSKHFQKRILFGILFPLFILNGCLCAASETQVLPCWFLEATGLYCPGCGSGRGVAATLRGDFGTAFRYNPMLYLLGIPAMGILTWEYIRMVFAVRRMKPVMLPQWLTYTVVAVVFLFWILRNVPAFSFLAPVG